MDHLKSEFTFKSGGSDVWKVVYEINAFEDYGGKYSCRVILNDDLYHDFETNIPTTNTSNPTKSQSLEIIRKSRKINKTREKREKIIKKILE
jgi:hypothetical protein